LGGGKDVSLTEPEKAHPKSSILNIAAHRGRKPEDTPVEHPKGTRFNGARRAEGGERK